MIRPVVRCVTMGHLVGVVLSQHGHAMWTLALIRQLLPLTGPDYSLKLHSSIAFQCGDKLAHFVGGCSRTGTYIFRSSPYIM